MTDDRMVGIGTMSPEGTSELRYIWRGAAGTPPPKSRSQWVGEIGWFMPFIDMQNMRTGHQINVSFVNRDFVHVLLIMGGCLITCSLP